MSNETTGFKTRFLTQGDIIMRPAMADTVRHVPVGESRIFKAKLTGPISSMRAAVSRANCKVGWEEYTIEAINNGEYYSITHNVM
jgi:hypothetical protein